MSEQPGGRAAAGPDPGRGEGAVPPSVDRRPGSPAGPPAPRRAGPAPGTPPGPRHGAPEPGSRPGPPPRPPVHGPDARPPSSPSQDRGDGGKGELSDDAKIKPVKVTGQALTAVTTAALGAFVAGAQGTVIGAALSSVVTTVGDALYTRSIERARDRVKTTVGARRRGGGAPATVEDADGVTRVVPNETDTRAMPGDGATRAMPGGHATRAMPGDGTTRAMHAPPPPPDDTPTQVIGPPDGDPADDAAPAEGRRRGLRRFAMLAATTVLIFLIAMVTITGIERVKGSPISGGPAGTSIGSVVGAREPTTPTEPESSTRPEESGSAETSAPSTTTTSRPGRTTAVNPGGGSGDEDEGSAPTANRSPGLGDAVPTGLLPGN